MLPLLWISPNPADDAGGKAGSKVGGFRYATSAMDLPEPRRRRGWQSWQQSGWLPLCYLCYGSPRTPQTTRVAKLAAKWVASAMLPMLWISPNPADDAGGKAGSKVV